MEAGASRIESKVKPGKRCGRSARRHGRRECGRCVRTADATVGRAPVAPLYEAYIHQCVLSSVRRARFPHRQVPGEGSAHAAGGGGECRRRTGGRATARVTVPHVNAAFLFQVLKKELERAGVSEPRPYVVRAGPTTRVPTWLARTWFALVKTLETQGR